MREGSDIALIGTGAMIQPSLEAAQMLAREGIKARVINMSTIKPIDRDAILAAARETKGIVTAEEHSVIGGLGGAVAEVVCEAYPVPVVKVGIRDVFGQSGEAKELMVHYGLTAEKIGEAARLLLRRKKTA